MMYRKADRAIPPMTVLVADDDEDMRSLVAETLRSEGYDVVEVCDGVELVDYLSRTLDEPGDRPGVVVSDVLMPNLSGLAVLEALRRAEWNVPVLLMTVLADDSVRTMARRLGAVGVLRKPLDSDALRTAVSRAAVAFARSRAAVRS
jgi:two-component system OmpR family response regulator